jgi:hypothetical protein
LVYANVINVLRASEENLNSLVAAGKENGIEVNVYMCKTKYMVISRVQDAGRSHSI